MPLTLKSKLLAQLRKSVAGLFSCKIKGELPTLPDLADGAPRRLAFLKIDGIGDFVLSTAFLGVAYKELSASDVTLLCNPLFEELARDLYPGWNIQAVPRVKGLAAMLLPRHRGFYRKICPFDLMVDLRAIRTWHDSLVASWVPAHCKVALKNQQSENFFSYSNESNIYNHLFEGPEIPLTHETCRDILNAQKLLRKLFHRLELEEESLAVQEVAIAPESGPVTKKVHSWPTLPDFPEIAQRLSLRFDNCSDVLALCPFSGEPIKEYPINQFAKAAGAFAQEHNLRIAILGGVGNQQQAGVLEGLLAPFPGVLNLAGQMSLSESTSFLRSVHATLSVDTGLAHLSIAQDTPTVVILGGGHYGQFAPWGDPVRVRWLTNQLPCFGCNWICSRQQPDCIRGILPAEIVKALEQVAGNGRALRIV